MKKILLVIIFSLFSITLFAASYNWPISGGGAGSGIKKYADYASLPYNVSNGDVAITLDTYSIWAYDSAAGAWYLLANGSPIILGAQGSAYDAEDNNPNAFISDAGAISTVGGGAQIVDNFSYLFTTNVGANHWVETVGRVPGIEEALYAGRKYQVCALVYTDTAGSITLRIRDNLTNTDFSDPFAANQTKLLCTAPMTASAAGTGFYVGLRTDIDSATIIFDNLFISRYDIEDAQLSSAVTKQGNTFNGASQLLQLDAFGKIPALDGSLLTNLNGTNISSGTVADARLTANVTLKGNTFNGVNQLVNTDGSGFLPALNGSLLTNLNGTNIASGTVADARLSSNVALKNQINSFTNANTFTNTVTLTGATASRLLATDASKNIVSADITSFLTGTANQVSVTTNGVGGATLATPQNIDITSSPSFTGLTVNNVDYGSMSSDSKSPTGIIGDIVNGTAGGCITSAAFVNPTITFTTVGSAPTPCTFRVQGVRYNYTVNKTATINPAVSGMIYVYFNNIGTLTASTSMPSLYTNALVAQGYWNNTSQTFISGNTLFDERHGVTMDPDTHAYLHKTIGTRWENGLAVSGNVLASGAPASDTNSTLVVTTGSIWDEDLNFLITSSVDAAPSARFQQRLGSSVNAVATASWLPVYYLSGTTASPVWNKSTADGFGFLYTGANGLPEFNYATGGNWTRQAVATTDFLGYYVYATNSPTEPIILIMDQANTLTANTASSGQFTTLPNAQSFITPSKLSLANLPFPEMKLLGRVIYQAANTYTNATHRSALRDITDYRNSGNLPTSAFTPTDHNSLINRTAVGSHTSTAVSFDNTTKTGALPLGRNIFNYTTNIDADSMLRKVPSIPSQASTENQVMNAGFESRGEFNNYFANGSGAGFGYLDTATYDGFGDVIGEVTTGGNSGTGVDIISLNTAKTNLYGKNGLASIWVRNKSAVAANSISIAVYDAQSAAFLTSKIYIDTTVGTKWTKIEMPFVYPTATSDPRIRILAEAAVIIDVLVDNAYIGENPKIGTVQQAVFKGAIEWANVAGTASFNVGGTSGFADFPSCAACAGATITYSGDALADASNPGQLPQVRLKNIQPGHYRIEAEGFFEIERAGPTAGMAWAISDGTTDRNAGGVYGYTGSSAAYVALPKLSSTFEITTPSSEKTFKLRAQTNGNSYIPLGAGSFAESNPSGLRIAVYYYPSSAQQVVSTNQSNNFAAVRWGGSAGVAASITSGTFTTFLTADTSTRTNIGAAVNGADVRNFSFKVPELQPGTYLAYSSGLMYSTAGTDCVYRLYDGTTATAQNEMLSNSGVSTQVGTIMGTFTYTGVQLNKEFHLQAYRQIGSGYCNVDVTTATLGFEIGLIPLSPQISMPIIANGVSTKIAAPQRISHGTIQTDGTIIHSGTGDWTSTRITTGEYGVTFNPSFKDAQYTCTGSAETSNRLFSQNAPDRTASYSHFITQSISSAATIDTPFSFICIGNN